MLASDIKSRVRDITGDADGDRWLDPELFRWMSDAQLFIGIYRPDAISRLIDFTCVEGAKQELPADCVRLLDIASQTSGREVTFIDPAVLAIQDPKWRTRSSSDDIKHFTYDNRLPRVFLTFPPAKAGTHIELIASVLPTDVTADAQVLDIADIYREAVVSYVCFRCYCKDVEANPQAASLHLQALSATLGIKLQKDAAFQPQFYNRSSLPSGPAIQGGGV
jgi:hypothetical protein